jgi:hypothetical protein
LKSLEVLTCRDGGVANMHRSKVDSKRKQSSKTPKKTSRQDETQDSKT